MATLATILRRLDTAGAEPRRATAPPSPYSLRALPNEDIFFYAKRVDNSRLVREADPRAKAECWSTIGRVSALAIFLIASLAPSVAGITASYKIQALKQERQQLLDERRNLEVVEAKLLGPDRLERLAKDQKMVSPGADQVVRLNTGASDGTVALNVSANSAK